MTNCLNGLEKMWERTRDRLGYEVHDGPRMGMESPFASISVVCDKLKSEFTHFRGPFVFMWRAGRDEETTHEGGQVGAIYENDCLVGVGGGRGEITCRASVDRRMIRE